MGEGLNECLGGGGGRGVVVDYRGEERGVTLADL